MVRKGKKKRSSFKVFDALDQKVEKDLVMGDYDSKYGRTNGFTHVPAEAFEPLLGFMEYSYLDNGLFVNTGLIQKEAAIWAGHASLYHACADMTTLKSVCWFDSKRIVESLGGKLPNLAELLCIKDYMGKTFPDSQLYKSICSDHDEWLDNLLDYYGGGNNKGHTIINSCVDGDQIIGGTACCLPDPDHLKGWGSPDQIDIRTGFPKVMTDDTDNPESDIWYTSLQLNSGHFDAPVAFQFMADDRPHFGVASFYADTHMPRVGFRMCVKPDDLEYLVWDNFDEN